MCEEAKASKEHAPPKCFFPEDKRINLITVPSCEKHNESNSDDVEYIVGLIVTSGANETAREHFLTILESWKKDNGAKGKKILAKAFTNNDGDTVIPTDEEKFYTIFSCMVSAFFFKDFREKINGVQWLNLFPDLTSTAKFQDTKEDGNSILRRKFTPEFEKYSYTQMKTWNPDVFQYFVYRDADIVIYKLLFYESFRVYSVNKFKK